MRSGRRGESNAEDAARAGMSGVQRMLNAQQREIELCRREREIAERELELARREIELMRRERLDDGLARANGNPPNVIVSEDTVRSQRKESVATIADLLSYFDGKTMNFDTWEKQIKLLKITYQLNDDSAKLVLGMRLKGRALEWLHSKSEYIRMSFDTLLGELRSMFQYRQSKLTMRKKFEERIWRRDETFHEYLHEKVIMGNRVPIDDDEMLECVSNVSSTVFRMRFCEIKRVFRDSRR